MSYIGKYIITSFFRTLLPILRYLFTGELTQLCPLCNSAVMPPYFSPDMYDNNELSKQSDSTSQRVKKNLYKAIT